MRWVRKRERQCGGRAAGVIGLQRKISGRDGQFTAALIKVENRFIIQSTCKKCGAFGLLPMRTGSLKRWRAGYKCEETNFEKY